MLIYKTMEANIHIGNSIQNKDLNIGVPCALVTLRPREQNKKIESVKSGERQTRSSTAIRNVSNCPLNMCFTS